MVPDEDRFWLTFTAANVEVARASAAIVRTITIHFDAFGSCVCYPQYNLSNE